MTCPYSNRSNCAMFDGGKRPSKEWYAEKIRGTLDDDTSAMSPQPQSQSAAVGEAVTDEQIIDLARIASTVNNYSNGRFVSAIFERDHAIRFARAVLALAAPTQPAKPNFEINRCTHCGYLQGHSLECPNSK